MIVMRFIIMANQQEEKFQEGYGTQVLRQELHGCQLKFTLILSLLNLIPQQQERFLV